MLKWIRYHEISVPHLLERKKSKVVYVSTSWNQAMEGHVRMWWVKGHWILIYVYWYYKFLVRIDLIFNLLKVRFYRAYTEIASFVSVWVCRLKDWMAQYLRYIWSYRWQSFLPFVFFHYFWFPVLFKAIF